MVESFTLTAEQGERLRKWCDKFCEKLDAYRKLSPEEKDAHNRAAFQRSLEALIPPKVYCEWTFQKSSDA